MTRDLLARAVVPARLALICRGGETLGYNPEFNVWHRMDETTAEVLRWLRAGRERNELQDHLEIRFGIPPDVAEQRLQEIIAWCLLRRLLYLDRQRQAAPASVPKNPLTTVYWICTQACNLRCAYCYQDAAVARADELSTSEAIDLIDQVVETGADTLIFTGGEPFVRRDLLQLAAYARSRSLRVNVITNGHYVTSANVRTIAETFNQVTVSLDHVVTQHHDVHRGEGSWERAWNAIELLVEAKIRVDVNSTLFRDGLQNLPELVRLKRKKGIGVHRIVPQFPMGRGIHDRGSELTPTELLNLNERLHEASRKESEGQSQEAPTATRKRDTKGRRRYHCGAGLSAISVDPEGWVYPCRLLQDAQFKTKNIRNQRLVQIFATDPILKTIQGRTVDTLHPCKTCIIKNDCGGGCRGIHFSFSQEHIQSHPLFCAHLRHAFELKAWQNTGEVPAYRSTGFVGESISNSQIIPISSLVRQS